MSLELSQKCRGFLSSLVIASIESVFSHTNAPCPTPDDSFSEAETACLKEPLGCFVTLKIGERLRGCIGSIIGYEPLYQNAWRMAQQAAFSDPRFPPLQEREWKACSIEISVLSALSPCPDRQAIQIGTHGLVLRYQGRTGVFLPQVPVEQNWSLSEYLTNLCYKAGVPDGSYAKPGAELYWYDATVFPVVR